MSDDEQIEVPQEKDQVIQEKKPKTFKDYYSNPEYREKHRAYSKEKVECDCGRMISRSNLNTHRKTPLHEKLLTERASTQKPKRQKKVFTDMDSDSEDEKDKDFMEIIADHVVKLIELKLKMNK